jgi:Flp pilus assembly pilin Flp
VARLALPGSRGQGVVEYGLILGGSVLVMVLTLVVFGPILSEIIRLVSETIDATGTPAY